MIYFCAGLPRSGSSLLLAVLNQNPDISVSVTSGLADILTLVRNNWDNAVHQALPADPTTGYTDTDLSQIKKRDVLNGIIKSYHPDKIIIDKSRAWPEHVELLKWLGLDVKILLPIRDIRDILASFERLYRDNPNITLPYVAAKPMECKTLAGRCEVLTHGTGIVGYAYNAIQDMVGRVSSKHYHWVDYDMFTNTPDKTMRGVYKFLGQPNFEHDFDNVESIPENDRAYGYPTIHKVRPKIEPQIPSWPKYLGDLGNKYTGLTAALRQ